MEHKPTNRDYFNALMRIVKKKFISPDTVNEEALLSVFEKGIAENNSDEMQNAHYATNTVLLDLDKKYKHSFFIPEWPPAALRDQETNALIVPHGEIKDDIAYISLPPCGGTDIEKGTYALEGNNLTTKLLKEKPIGFIVDLSKNSGGDCHPMLATLAPLLDRKNHVRWANAKREIRPGVRWDHVIGYAWNEGKLKDYYLQRIRNKPYEPSNPLPLAVIYADLTRSSGEVAALALKGRPLAQSFGKATGGYTTGNDIYDTPYPKFFGEGKFALTGAFMTDRDGKIYDSSINPDVETNYPFEDAKIWIKQQAKPS